jgi:hypothetical protein
MRIMLMHKNTPDAEAGVLPSHELITQMGAFIGAHIQAGRFIDGAGLLGSKARTRLVFKSGVCTTKRGPYAGAHELPAAVWQLKVDTLEQGLGWAERYGKILGDCELELGKVTENWDLGLMPEPENAPLQLLLVEKADAVSERGERSPQQKAALARLKTEMQKAGVLLGTLQLAPSRDAKRLAFDKNALTVTDGPFTESKELIGGFSIMELADFDEAIALCRPYAAILGGTLEIDLRVVVEHERSGQ